MTGAREGLRRVERTARSRVVVGGIGILGRIKVTPMWADDPLQIHIGGGGVGEVEGCLPQKEISRRE